MTNMSAPPIEFPRSFEDVTRDQAIPGISAIILLVAVFVSGFNYFIIDYAASLFFYAVLVMMWTQLGPPLQLSRDRDWAFITFLAMAAAAVILGIQIEWVVERITGNIIAVQSLALAILASRIYLNLHDDAGLWESLRWNEPVDRYLIWIPCGLLFLLPILIDMTVFQLRLETRTSFFYMIAFSWGVGTVLQLRAEKL